MSALAEASEVAGLSRGTFLGCEAEPGGEVTGVPVWASGVSPEMALRLSKCLGRTSECGLAMQRGHDFW